MRKHSAAGVRLLVGIATFGAGTLLAPPVWAFKFDAGPVRGSLDTVVSAGASWRMEDRKDALVCIANGGTSRSCNDDDGNLNYDKGDPISATLKATHDLEIKYGDNVGIFQRLTYFYDFQAREDRDNFGRRGRDSLISELDYLDGFVYLNFKLNGRPSSVRFGKQVVNWGESTFIQNSLNVINPVDLTRLRTPGSELKEALLPVPMFWGTTSLTPTVSLEGVWLWSYQETVLDPRGSYFSSNDFLSDDGRLAYTGGGRRNDGNATSPLSAGTAPAPIQRVSDDRPRGETQQYGVALRYFADWLNSTEFGLYYLKYHSRLPVFSGLRATDTTSPATRVASARYFAEYPENIELFGLSFNTDGPLGVALQGEYSYRPNLPVQLAGVEGLLAALRLPNVIDAEVGPTYFATAPTRADGYRRVHAHQAQMTGTKVFGPTLGAQQFTMLGEAGVTFLELDRDLLYAGPGTTTVPSCRNRGALVDVITAAGNGSCQNDDGFLDRTSWGYRMVARMDYENAIGAASVSPRIVFSHDVNGTGPAFNQGTKAATLGVGFNYLQRWQADIGYTLFFGGRHYSGTDPIPPGTPGLAGSATQSADYETSANPLEDRDFLAVSLSYAF